MYDIYCKLRDLKGVKDSQVASATGITKSTFSDWKNGRSNPKQEKLQKIADYFGVTVEYLMTGKEDTPKEPTLTPRDERDVQKMLEETLAKLEDPNDGLMFSGEPLDDETKELLKAILESSMRIAKIAVKKNFTPQKYRKEGCDGIEAENPKESDSANA